MINEPVDPNLSIVRGSKAAPLWEITVGDTLKRAAATWPEVDALVSVEQAIRWNYADFERRVYALASGLTELGLRHGDRLGIWSPNCAEWALTQFATGVLGIILVNINPAYRLVELEYTLNKVGVKALISARAFKSSNYVAMLEAPSHAIEQAKTLVDCGQPINIQFTSGTTGQPKGATLSHRNIVNNAYFVGQAVGLQPKDRLCIPVPLYHCFGMVMSNLACVVHGATMIFPSAGFDPLAVLLAVAREKCTLLYGVPTMYIAELEHPRFAEFDLSSLRGGIMSGAPCPIEVMQRVVESMHMKRITIAYGMTETSPVSFQSSTEDSLERRVTTVGRVQPNLECKLINAQGEIVPRGEPGEFCVRGYSVMLGYWDDADKTAQAVDQDGWMHTGDLGILDIDGYAQVAGRRSDMIIRGGENVYPREIEDFLLRHPDVIDAAVVGLPDLKYGEAVCAWIKLRPNSTAGEEDIKNHCRGHIAHYKVPNYVVFVEDFPTTVTGKIRKNVMREESAVRFKLRF